MLFFNFTKLTLRRLITTYLHLIVVYLQKLFLMSFTSEIQRRRTFGIVSHPDAGKTTLTEKLLLFGGAIQEAGAVKSNKIKKF